MIRVMVLGIVRAILVTAFLLVSAAIVLVLSAGMLMKALRVVPKDDDLASILTKLYSIGVDKMKNRGALPKAFDV